MSEKEACQRNGKDFATTSAYVTQDTIYNAKGAFVTIRNTHATSTMYYKITGYVSPAANCPASVIQAETSIAAATTIELPSTGVAEKLNQPWFKIVVDVKQNSAAGTGHLSWIAY